VAGASGVAGSLRTGFESLIGQGAELVGGSKVVAVAASAAIVAGGGAATVSELKDSAAPVRPNIVRQEAKAKSPTLPPGLSDPSATGGVAPAVRPKPGEAAAAPVNPAGALGGTSGASPPPAAPAPKPPPPNPANEFAPGGGGGGAAPASSGGGGGEFSPGGGGGSGGGEFGP
jgi:hypothetical protein